MLMEVVIHRLTRGYDGDRNPCMNSLGVCLCRTVGSTCLISSARDTALKGDELRPSDDVPLHGRYLLWVFGCRNKHGFAWAANLS